MHDYLPNSSGSPIQTKLLPPLMNMQTAAIDHRSHLLELRIIIIIIIIIQLCNYNQTCVIKHQ